VTLHCVVLAWLRAERHKWASKRPALLDDPDLDSPTENRHRLRLLYAIRGFFVMEIPPDTVWYEVRNLQHAHLGELHAIDIAGWTDRADRNEIVKVAMRKPSPLRKPPPEWELPILWGHSRAGPFTILEGNTRLSAYAGSGLSDLDIPILVGLSPMMCLWHIHDACGPLMQDMYVARDDGPGGRQA
jgi:hypothetical protein